MSQDDYDKGYEDGRNSRGDEVAGLKARYAEARADLAAAQDEAQRLSNILHRPRPGSDALPF